MNVRPLSAFPFASTTIIAGGSFNTDNAEEMKEWVWMVRKWRVTIDLLVSAPAENPGFSFPTFVKNAGDLGLGGFTRELDILDYRGTYAEERIVYPPGPSDGGFTMTIGGDGSWGDIFNEDGQVLTDETTGLGNYAWPIAILCDYTDDAGGTSLFAGNAGGSYTTSAAKLVFYGVEYPLIEDAITFTWSGTITIEPAEYWPYVDPATNLPRFNIDTGAPV